jgi:predicted Zn-dependent protease
MQDARAAIARNPLAAEPHWVLGELYIAVGDPGAGRREFVRAVNLQPENPDTWQALGSYDLSHGRLAVALNELTKAYALHVNSTQLAQLIQKARSELAARTAPHASG